MPSIDMFRGAASGHIGLGSTHHSIQEHTNVFLLLQVTPSVANKLLERCASYSSRWVCSRSLCGYVLVRPYRCAAVRMSQTQGSLGVC